LCAAPWRPWPSRPDNPAENDSPLLPLIFLIDIFHISYCEITTLFLRAHTQSDANWMTWAERTPLHSSTQSAEFCGAYLTFPNVSGTFLGGKTHVGVNSFVVMLTRPNQIIEMKINFFSAPSEIMVVGVPHTQISVLKVVSIFPENLYGTRKLATTDNLRMHSTFGIRNSWEFQNSK
jgi:hypothetical protein